MIRIYNILLEFYTYDTVSPISKELCLSFKTWDLIKVIIIIIIIIENHFKSNKSTKTYIELIASYVHPKNSNHLRSQ